MSETENLNEWLDLLEKLSELNGDFVAKAMLQKQYFPNVKQDAEELPPIFSSDTFTIDAAAALRALPLKQAAWVELRARRFDGLVRRLGIPHPVPYSKLVLHLRDNWARLAPILDSANSRIKPMSHDDGRVIHMDYGGGGDQHNDSTRLAQGKRYMVKADISNCFPSIYSHALDWALRGKATAKADQKPTTWQAKVDQYARWCMNNETKGVLIGPAVSNVLAEIILQRIDEEFADVAFVRYIDDYSAYFATRDEAEGFVVRLQRALSRYRLDLNTRKTHVVSLREGIGDSWMAEVLSHLPAELSPLAVARFLQQAELLARRHPADSVLKFAAKTVLGSAEGESSSLVVIDELVRITQFHPHLLSILSRELGRFEAKGGGKLQHLVDPLREQLTRAIKGAETDSILWLTYILKDHLDSDLGLADAVFSEMLELNDDLVWLAVASLEPVHTERIASYVDGLDYIDSADRQSHWLGRYEFWRTGHIGGHQLSPEERSWMDLFSSSAVAFTSLVER